MKQMHISVGGQRQTTIHAIVNKELIVKIKLSMAGLSQSLHLSLLHHPVLT